MQTSNEDFDKEEAERNAKQIIFNEEVKRLRVLSEENARKQKDIFEESAREEARIKKEWLNENGYAFRDWPENVLEPYSLEQLKQLAIQLEGENSKSNTIVVSSLILIFVAIVSYIAKAYLVLTLDLFILFVYWCIAFGSDAKPNEHMKCPHCGTKGQVFTNLVTVKKGIDGGKATGALLTGGWSMLFTGLSREENQTQARCGKCGSVWHF